MSTDLIRPHRCPAFIFDGWLQISFHRFGFESFSEDFRATCFGAS